ncbi:hypothetical protein ACI7YW_09195 [Clostridium ljungdahlii]|uniref:hypothetical protein n=1 Tax=Clostridium ljungdahlii TaxID=1538 RepID=UPI00386A0483
MKKVYFKAINSYSKTEEISDAAGKLLKKVVEEEHISLEKFIPLKVPILEKRVIILSYNRKILLV